jgi:thiamine-monophosphate kinase
LAVNVSDIAAMGGTPRHAVVSLALPSSTPQHYIRALLEGMRRCARRFGVTVVGGDTVGAPCLSITITLTGSAPRGRICRRSGARPGDLLAVTGPLGGSLASGRHLTFMPRLPEALWLMQHLRPHAMMDLSDGLALDGARMAAASQVRLALRGARIPRAKRAALADALHDGEDFELLVALSPRRCTAARQQAFARAFRRRLHIIGVVEHGAPAVVVDGRPLAPRGFEHFADD